MTLCLVFRIFDVFDILPFHNIVYCIIACANLKYHLSIVIFEEPLTAYYAIWQTIVAHIAALVSCLGQGPCFSKITYMVTACNYSEGMYSTVVYCAFF